MYLLRAVQADERERALHPDAEPVLVAAEPLLDVGVVVHPYDLGAVVHFVVDDVQACAEKRPCFDEHQPGATRQNFLAT